MTTNTDIRNTCKNDSLRKPNVPSLNSWPIIIIFFIIFQPISWLLMYQRSKIDKESNGAISVISGFFAVCFMMYTLLFLFMRLTSTGSDYNDLNLPIVFVCFLSGVCFYIYHLCRKSLRKFQRFTDIVFTRNIRRIDEVARTLGISSEAVIEYFNELIRYGYIIDGHVKDGYLIIDGEVSKEKEYDQACDCDHGENDESIVEEHEEGYDDKGNYYSRTKINVYSGDANSSLNYLTDNAKKPQKEPRSGTVPCKNCGATVELKGFGAVACEYCDTAN